MLPLAFAGRQTPIVRLAVEGPKDAYRADSPHAGSGVAPLEAKRATGVARLGLTWAHEHDAEQTPLRVVPQGKKPIFGGRPRRVKNLTPELRLVVPSNAHHLRALDRDDPDTLHRQRRYVSCHFWRHSEDHMRDSPIFTRNLPRKHQSFKCKALPSRTRYARRDRTTLKSCWTFTSHFPPPRLVSKADVNDDKWKRGQATPRLWIQTTPQISVGQVERPLNGDHIVIGQFTEKVNALLIHLMGKMNGCRPLPLRERR